ncbi:hypothetical protein ACJZ2D_000625 [Fusarium nematophilum]
MPNYFETVLLIGATSEIGEELGRQYHAAGKKVIISGRRTERLKRLKSEVTGVEAIQAFSQFPSINAVILVAGQQNYYNFNTARPAVVPGKGAPNTADISSKVATNPAGPIILTREIIQQALSGLREEKPFTLGLVTSGLAYVPAPIFPVYCASNAALHQFIVSMRAQLAGTKIHLVEIIPPCVKTELDSHHQDDIHASMDGMSGQDVGTYVAGVLRGMDKVGEDGHPPTLVAEGFPLVIAATWANAFASIGEHFGFDL